MKQFLAAAALAAIPLSATAERRAVVHDPVVLNIGVTCQWQPRCIAQQRRAMTGALGFVARSRPSLWRLQLCNRNASRGGDRFDWVGFDHCIRNADLRQPATPTKKRRQ
ncbi:hypothetical protein [Sphingomonas sp.]|uniref:hypothetical protein n=1 Tax=Sphingomonas sp. TaxID=28214 RepID=UPI0038A5A94D